MQTITTTTSSGTRIEIVVEGTTITCRTESGMFLSEQTVKTPSAVSKKVDRLVKFWNGSTI